MNIHFRVIGCAQIGAISITWAACGGSTVANAVGQDAEQPPGDAAVPVADAQAADVTMASPADGEASVDATAAMAADGEASIADASEETAPCDAQGFDGGCERISSHVLVFDADAGASARPFAWLAVPLNLDVTRAVSFVALDGHGWNENSPPFQATTLSTCGQLNEAESARNLDAFGTGAPRATANVRRVVLQIVANDSSHTFCLGFHQTSGPTTGRWHFHPVPVPTVSLNSVMGVAGGESDVTENAVDMLAILVNGDSVLRSIEYDTSP